MSPSGLRWFKQAGQSWTLFERSFEVVVGVVAKGGVAALGVVVGDVVADFKLGFSQTGEATAVEQFGLEAALKRFGVGVVVAAAALAHALLRAVPSQ
jgi:hypothetical protein